MTEKLELRQIREFGAIVSDTFVFIRQNLKPLLKSFFTICGIFIVAGIISMVLYQLQAQQWQAPVGSEGIWQRTLSGSVLTWEYFLLLVFSILSYVSMYVTVLSFVALYIQKGNNAPNVDEVWAYFKFYFFRLLGSSIVMSIFLIVCFVCCILPGIYVFPAVTLFYPIMVLENGSFSHSFERSFKLLKEEWWITAAVLVIIYIIFYMASFIVQVPALILQMIATFMHAESPVRSVYAIASACLTYLAQVFMLIPIISSCLIYFNLVERKESTGLLGRINAMGNNNAQENIHPEEY
jgi:hypothetical protein